MSSPAPPAPGRLASLDAYRGLVLALMMGEALRFCGVAAALPTSAFWAFRHHQDHVAWVGGSLHDLIQPGFPFLLGLRPRREQWWALGVILVAFWAAFTLYPAPGPDFDWQSAGVPPDWPHQLRGFAAHWNKNENFSAQFDRWFLNLFPREQPNVFNRGSYQRLSFIPTLGTMILAACSPGASSRATARRGRRGAGW
jgi:hypothetical protein